MAVTCMLIFSIAVATMGMYQFGLNLTVMNSPQKEIESFINSTSSSPLTQSSITLMFSMATGSYFVGGLIGALLSGFLMNKFGRKGALLLAQPFSIVGGIGVEVCELASSYYLLVIGRVIIGCACGLFTSVSPLYVSEIAPISIRGRLGAVNQLAITTGILSGNVLGLKFLLGREDIWPILLAIGVIPSILMLVSLPSVPETPSYLIVFRKRYDAGREALVTLRGQKSSAANLGDTSSPSHYGGEVDREFREILDSSSCDKRVEVGSGEDNFAFNNVRSSNDKISTDHTVGDEGNVDATDDEGQSAECREVSLMELLSTRKYYLPLFVCITVHASQQLSGIVGIFYYSTSFFTESGMSEEEARYATVGVGAMMVLMTFVTMKTIDVWGRRVLHIGGLVVMLMATIIITILLNVRDKYYPDSTVLPPLLVAATLSFVVGFALGPGSIPWLLTSEMFSREVRSSAVTVATSFNWSFNLLVSLTFPSILAAFGSFLFVPYFTLIFISIVILYLYMPETKGQTPEFVEHILTREGAWSKPNRGKSE